MNGLSVTNGYDPYLRRTNLAACNASTLLALVTNSYDAASRLQTVTALDSGLSTLGSASYTYLSNSPLVSQIYFTNSGVRRMTTTKTHDYLNRLTSISSINSQQATIHWHSYAYNTANQRTAVTNADNSRWIYAYDSLGQTISGKKYWSAGTPVAGQQFEYSFDDIGNRNSAAAGGDQYGANLRYAAYTANNLNQYLSRTVPGYVNILGEATNTATVTVNNQSTYRRASYFRGELNVDNSGAALWVTTTNLAVLNNGSNPDIIATNTGSMFVPLTPEQFGYDADGNLTNDGRWAYTWDAENRLIKVESRSGAPAASKGRVTWEFDAKGRRIRQTTYDGSSGSYNVVLEDLKFLSDGWRHIAELNATNNALIRSYTWGLDLSSSMDSAGGVCGLVMINSAANGAHFYAYDGNGNVAGLVKASDGTVSALYEYEPFGIVLRATGPMADENRFQFSTKRCDRTTDFELYEYRVRRPDLAWLSRDPIGESGGSNLYALCNNAGCNAIDLLGLACGEAIGKNGKPRYVFTEAPPRGGWKGVIEFKDKAGSAQAQAVGKIVIRWKADIAVLCNCPCGVRYGTRILVNEHDGCWLEYDPNSLPMGLPIVTSVWKGIGELIAKGIEKIIANSMAVSPESEINDMIKTINSDPAPTTPWDGAWQGGRSPCDK